MYGQIHVVVRELVLEKFGGEVWSKIIAEAKMTDEHFLVFHKYSDEQTFVLVGAVSKVLDVPLAAVLELFGEYFLVYCLRHGYDKMLLTLARDITSFIQNLDSLHSLLALTYKNIEAPSFRCQTNADGSLQLHYYSVRPGLYPIVIGLVRAVARDIFNQEVEMVVEEQNTEILETNRRQEHTVFNVVVRNAETERVVTPTPAMTKQGEITGCPFGGGPANADNMAASVNEAGLLQTGLLDMTMCLCSLPQSDTTAVVQNQTSAKQNFTTPLPFQISPAQFCSAFPYHVAFDSSLRLRQCGTMILKLLKSSDFAGLEIPKFFRLVQPRMELTVENIKKFINAIFILAVGRQDLDIRKEITLKGQMIWLPETDAMIFIGSPRLTSLNELLEMNVFLADIPLYDVTRELVLLNQQRIAEIDVAKKLDETTMELKATSKALELEKQKTDNLLYQMLPAKVAEQLKEGKKVDAEKFESVTILFSDIVTFTTIAARSSPMDIVLMLNQLYQHFDEKTGVNGVYKVETIGDAYMVVGGVPEPVDDHAVRVCNFAIDMVHDAALVSSPVTGEPIQIRVGAHSGPVVAGVVGVKMPRYCLFGDTVNTASRMESHGVPGRVHVSPSTYKALEGKGYRFRPRGEIQVKGKGAMNTYFLVGTTDKPLNEPKDEYSKLPVIDENHTDGGELLTMGGTSNNKVNDNGNNHTNHTNGTHIPRRINILDQEESRLCVVL